MDNTIILGGDDMKDVVLCECEMSVTFLNRTWKYAFWFTERTANFLMSIGRRLSFLPFVTYRDRGEI